MERVIRVMLVEKDPPTCMEFCALLEQERSMRLVFRTGRAAEALDYLRVHPLDVLFLDFDETMSADELPAQIFACAAERPLVLVMTDIADEDVLQQLRMSGVDYIYRKTNPSFSPKRMIEIAKYLYPHRHAAADEPEDACSSDAFERLVIAQRLRQMGFLRRYVAFAYAEDAIIQLLRAGEKERKLTRDIYPKIAKRHKMSAVSVERSLRSAIKSVFTGVPPKKMFLDYPFPYDQRRGYPTNAEFLSNFAAWMREDAELFAEDEEPDTENNGSPA